MLEPRYKNEGYQLPVQAWYPEVNDDFSEGDCFIDFDNLEDAERFANDLLADVEKLRTQPKCAFAGLPQCESRQIGGLHPPCKECSRSEVPA